MHCAIVPPFLLRRLAALDDVDVAATAGRTLALDARVRAARPERLPRREGALPGPRPAERPDRPDRTISDAGGTTTLPGRTVRREGDGPTGDPAADEAYDGLGATFALYLDAYDRRSIDDAGAPLPATVHYGRDYDNAFWDGERMVFGDGDGRFFRRFTVAVDVIGHELTHGVVQVEAALTYSGQSGALNESVCDVVGSLVKQHALGQTAAEADWLVGAGLFTDRVRGRALRSLAAPGTAFDDPVLGKDPQPAHMDHYVDTADDNGGVHLNSGIPNHAFYLAATALGGPAWERAGLVWYDALRHPSLHEGADFAAFAALTVRVARRRYGEGSDVARAVADGWDAVGVGAPLSGWPG